MFLIWSVSLTGRIELMGVYLSSSHNFKHLSGESRPIDWIPKVRVRL